MRRNETRAQADSTFRCYALLCAAMRCAPSVVYCRRALWRCGAVVSVAHTKAVAARRCNLSRLNAVIVTLAECGGCTPRVRGMRSALFVFVPW